MVVRKGDAYLKRDSQKNSLFNSKPNQNFDCELQLNIPFPKSSIKDKDEEVINQFSALSIKERSKSESSDESDDDFISKGPETNRNQIRQKNKETTNPYPVGNFINLHNLHCGGDVQYNPALNICAPLPQQTTSTPQVFQALSYESEPVQDIVAKIYQDGLNESQRETLNCALDKAEEEESEITNEVQEPCLDFTPPDSAYGSAYSSPSSSISPYPTRSPNQTPAPAVYAPSDTDLFSLSTSPGTIVQDDKWPSPLNKFVKQNVIPVGTKSWPPATNQEIGGHKGQILPSSIWHARRNHNLLEASSPKLNISPNVLPYNQESFMYNYPQQNVCQTGRPVATIAPAISSRITFRQPYGHQMNVPQIKPEGVIVQQAKMKECSFVRIQRNLVDNKKLVEWVKACNKSNFYDVTAEGKTCLMDALLQNRSQCFFLESIYVHIERIKKDKNLEFLKQRDINNWSALSIAAIKCADIPLIARYIADTIVFLNGDPDEIYDDKGNTLLHMLVEQGDSHVEVLAELLNAYKPDKSHQRIFNMNKFNLKNETPLHIAVLKESTTVVDILVQHGSRLDLADNNRMTPLHLAIRYKCNPEMIKKLLKYGITEEAINKPDLELNTPLHYAADRNDVPLPNQISVISQLINSKAKYNLPNRNNKVAFNLVDPSRKEELRCIMHGKMKHK